MQEPKTNMRRLSLAIGFRVPVAERRMVSQATLLAALAHATAGDAISTLITQPNRIVFANFFVFNYGRTQYQKRGWQG
jgi:hypothetical protein